MYPMVPIITMVIQQQIATTICFVLSIGFYGRWLSWFILDKYYIKFKYFFSAEGFLVLLALDTFVKRIDCEKNKYYPMLAY